MSNQDVRATTLRYLVDKKVMTTWQKMAFLEETRRAGGIENYQGGYSIERIIGVNDPHVTTELVSGYEALNLTTGDSTVNAVYNASRFIHPIIISNKALDENNGKQKVASLMEKRVDLGLLDFMKKLNRQVLLGNVAGVTSLNTLNGQVAGGFLEGVARASQTGTVGGLSKATNGEGWRNAFGDAGAAFSTDGKTAMDNIWTEVVSFGQSAGKKYIIASPASFRNYKRVLFAQERYVDQKSLDGGVMRLMYDGAPIALDPAMDFSAFGTQFSMYFLDADAVKLAILGKKYFSVEPFERNILNDTQVANIVFHGQLIADALAPCGVLIRGNTW